MAASSLFRSAVFQLTLATVAVLGLATAAVIVLVGLDANQSLTRGVENAIEGDARALRSALDTGGIDSLIAAVSRQSSVAGAGIYILSDGNGRKLAGNLDQLPAKVSSAAEGGPQRGLFTYRPPNSAGSPSTTRMAAGLIIDVHNLGQIFVGRDVEDQRALLSSIYRRLALGLGFLCVLGIGAGLLLARYILARIDAMNRASSAIMSGDLSGRLPRGRSNDELDRLADHLNLMLERIERLMAGMREVSDNIAHDLRTPLNRLRNRAEAALSDRRGDRAWKEGLERTIEDADELIKTFNALLLIARLEAGAMEESIESIDLAALVRGIAELYAPAAEEAGLGFTCEISEPVFVRGNRQLIGQALANLIDNAIKYASRDVAPADKPIAITLAAADGSAILTVADGGPGIPAAERARALRRFGRLDQSRSRPGTGLGLNLVAAVAGMHHGTLALEDNAPGLRVVLTMPLDKLVQGEARSGVIAPQKVDA
jgi:signal transduction histidine kinase